MCLMYLYGLVTLKAVKLRRSFTDYDLKFNTHVGIDIKDVLFSLRSHLLPNDELPRGEGIKDDCLSHKW